MYESMVNTITSVVLSFVALAVLPWAVRITRELGEIKVAMQNLSENSNRLTSRVDRHGRRLSKLEARQRERGEK